MNDDLRWISLVVYWSVVVLCGANARIATSSSRPWWVLCGVSGAIAINAQLELASIFTRVLRRLAWQYDWYRDRTELQLVSVALIGVLILGFIGLGVVMTARAKWLPSQRICLGAAVWLAGLALLRAVSLHQIDAFLYTPRGGIQLNWMLEFGGLGGMVFVLLRSIVRRKKR